MRDARINHPYYNPPEKPKRMRLILPFVIFGIILAIYTAYWIYASREIRAWADDWIISQQEAGYAMSHGKIGVGGYPFRFTLNVADPDITAPEQDGGWQARFEAFQASAMPWDFNHWIMSFKGPIELASLVDGEPALYEITPERAQVSISSSRGLTQRVGAEIENMNIVALQGPQPGVTRFERFALAGVLGDDDIMVTSIETIGLELTEGQMAANIENGFGRVGELIRLDGQITQWSALASEGDVAMWARDGGGIQINGSQLEWGPALIAGDGILSLDAEQRLIGRLSVIIGDPESLVDALVTAGLVEDGQGDALRLAAMMAPRREGGIALPLRFQQGGIFLGPARVGCLGSVN